MLAQRVLIWWKAEFQQESSSKNSDLGGGSSTMGTLSGGNKEIITVGENCSLGANSGIGISLGDNCTVEAGLYVTAGTKSLTE